MTGLHISDTLSLPEDAVTETFAILAKRGKGKTNTAVVMAEEMIAVGLPVIVIDPVGVWWGLRSSADGQAAGLPVVIFGGDHADVPLEETAGTLVADVLVEQRFPAVIDLSALSKSAARRFMTPFLERLYHRNREALHVIVDEADAFAPQRAAADGARLLGAMEDLVRRGRARGIGVTLITQRPAVIHKDVLTQAEVLIALGMTGPRDVAAIDEWVKLHADEDQAKEVKASLPGLPVGTAWVWSPGWLDILQRVEIRARTTFDSSATPKAGEKRRTPKRMADVDLAALGEQIAATVEKGKADDPRKLRARIRDLEEQLADALANTPEPIVERVEVPVLAPEIVDQIEALLSPAAALLGETQETLLKHRMWAEQQLNTRPPQEGKQGSSPTRSSAPRAVSTSSTPGGTPGAGPSTHREKNPPAARETRPAAAGGPPPDEPPLTLGKTERTILSVLAQHGPRTHSQLALLSGYSPKASTIGVAAARLRRAGLLERGAPYTATPEGLAWIADKIDPLPEGQALLDYWRHRFGKTEQAVLDALLQLYPEAGTQALVAEMTGYSPTASTIGVALSKLRKVEVVNGWRISDDFADSVGLA